MANSNDTQAQSNEAKELTSLALPLETTRGSPKQEEEDEQENETQNDYCCSMNLCPFIEAVYLPLGMIYLGTRNHCRLHEGGFVGHIEITIGHSPSYLL